ncbi:MAG: RNA-directed DNA polymerase [Planctomycetes bacterium]|nr:RNA-directed DNA polymerase [Planctomycetota bacterium]
MERRSIPRKRYRTPSTKEASGTERERSYAPHSTDESGEPARPGPTGGKEGTGRRIEKGKYREDAERVLKVLHQRFAKYGLTLHPEKTRLVELGRYAAQNRARQEKGRPETLDFLGFTHLCARSRRGFFAIHLRTMRKRFRRSLKAVSRWCQQHRHDDVEAQSAELNLKLRGHYQYYGRSTNFPAIQRFFEAVKKVWRKWLARRTRGRPLTWPDFRGILARLPLLRPRITRSWAREGSHA